MSADQEGGASKQSKIIVDEDWKAQAQAEKEALQAEVERKRRQGGARDGEGGGSAEPELPPASMSALISSLATQAALALQGVPNENGPALPPDLKLARHLIDLLGVLEEKTAGNLDEAESKMLVDVHRQLQLLYVETATYLSKQSQSSDTTSTSK